MDTHDFWLFTPKEYMFFMVACQQEDDRPWDVERACGEADGLCVVVIDVDGLNNIIPSFKVAFNH